MKRIRQIIHFIKQKENNNRKRTNKKKRERKRKRKSHSNFSLDINFEIYNSYFNGLNESQLKCINTHDGPLLVLAGAGTGKTRVISLRLLKILEIKKVKLNEVLVVTFTNKAANEMKDRIMKLINIEDIKNVWIGTFHSLCVKILRKYFSYLNLKPNFTILSAEDSKQILVEICKNQNTNGKDINDVLKTISKWKNLGYYPSEVQFGDKDTYYLKEVYSSYKNYLERFNSVDFDDLIMLCNKLFKEKDEVLREYQKKFKYIMVDEFQDSNISQYTWLNYLAKKHKNICCLGDDDQSIYKFRGAEVANITNFKIHYPELKIILLEQNYRSTYPILKSANLLIKKNKVRHDKQVWTEQKSGDLIELNIYDNPKSEAEHVVNKINDLKNNKEKLSQIAILIRQNSLSKVFEDQLTSLNIPFLVIGTSKFYHTSEIQDALSFIKIIINPDDDISFQKILKSPILNFPKSIIKKIEELSDLNKFSYYNACQELIQKKSINNEYTSLKLLLENYMKWKEILNSISMRPYELVQLIMKESSYIPNLEKIGDISKINNLNELFLIIENFDNLEDFIQYAILNSEEINKFTEKDFTEYVQIMTLHCAKGLEFDNVFLPAWEEGSFPNTYFIKKEEDFEEERRLAYVGLTRARKRLFISYSKFRFSLGNKDIRRESRFISELSTDLLKRKDFSSKYKDNWNNNNFEKSYFGNHHKSNFYMKKK